MRHDLTNNIGSSPIFSKLCPETQSLARDISLFAGSTLMKVLYGSYTIVYPSIREIIHSLKAHELSTCTGLPTLLLRFSCHISTGYKLVRQFSLHAEIVCDLLLPAELLCVIKASCLDCARDYTSCQDSRQEAESHKQTWQEAIFIRTQ